MRFQLYEFEIKRPSGIVAGHVLVSSGEHALRVIGDQNHTPARPQAQVSVKRVDHTLTGDLRDGLDGLLENTPACFASHCSIGWVAHVAPGASAAALPL